MKKILFFLVFFLVFSSQCLLKAQGGVQDTAAIRAKVRKQMQSLKPEDIVDGIYKKRTTFERSPAPLPLTREADVIWQKLVWRRIDFREKANLHFYYPTSDINGRSNLINLLLRAIKDGCLAFKPSPGGYEFETPIGYTDIFSTVVDTSGTNTYSLKKALSDVKQLLVKELWYFDKQKSTLQVRIIGICPIVVRMKNGQPNENELFWIYYPQVRPYLSINETLNSLNGARNLSFDDIFLTRRFDGYIVKEENTYNNRAIENYADGEYAALESDRIKNAIFNYEQDLWEY